MYYCVIVAFRQHVLNEHAIHGTRRAGTIFQQGRGSRSQIAFYHVTWMARWPSTHMYGPTVLIQGPRDVAELTTGHLIFATLYVNAGTWSLMY